MPWNGSGTFAREHDWTDDANSAIDIEASRMDEEDDNFATGLNNCLTLDGQNTATQVNCDNLRLDGNTVSSTNTNGNIILDPNGSGVVQTDAIDINGGAIDDVTLGTNSPVTSAVITTADINAGTFDGVVGGTTPAAGSFTTLNISDRQTISNSQPQILMVETGAAANNTSWSFLVDGEQLRLRLLNDALSSATNIFTIDRTLNNVDAVNFANGTLQAGGIAVPTISSTSTLTNKTINLSSNTLTTTIAQLNTAVSDATLAARTEGSYTATATGLTTTPTGTVYYSIAGDVVTISVPDISGTSDDDSFTLIGGPTAIRPSATTGRTVVYLQDSTSDVLGSVQMNTAGVLIFSVNFNDTFTSSGTKGSRAFVMTYNLTNS